MKCYFILSSLLPLITYNQICITETCTGESAELTLASLMAFSGMVMQGKEYMAPCTGLQLMPCTVFRTCSVSLAFSAKTLKVAVRSWTRKRENTEEKKQRSLIHLFIIFILFYCYMLWQYKHCLVMPIKLFKLKLN